MNHQEIFCERLRLLRDKRGLSQQQAAESLGMTRNGYQNYELGRRKPTFDCLIALANFFEVSLDYLCGRD